VVQELALGSIRDRTVVLRLLSDLRQFPVLTHPELMTLVDAHELWGRGLSAVDVQLLGSVALVGGARLWTRDKRLVAASRDVGVASVEEA
jgi:predicted nucleic acid-binding protein